ncbi:MAG: DUF6485 family protein [Candidatus Aenigmatarchaeota archaeon]
MKECKEKANKEKCPCTYEPCSRKGICCECIRYHLKSKELPACFFSKSVEKTYDRSIENFIKNAKQS